MTETADLQPSKQPEDVKKDNAQFQSALQSRNIRIHNRRTSVRLEPEMWSAMAEIAGVEGCSIHDLCGAVHDLKEAGASFTAALRVFLMEYYRAAVRASPRVSLVQQKIKAKGQEQEEQAPPAEIKTGS